MRLIGTLKDLEQAKRFSAFLFKQNVENKLETITVSDWGSDKYGEQEISIWVIEEESFAQAMEWLEKFYKEPNNPIFDQTATTPSAFEINEEDLQIREKSKEPSGSLTLYLIIICALLFGTSALTEPAGTRIAVPYPYTAIYSSKIMQEFLFDFPKAFSIINVIANTYGVKALANPSTMPIEGQLLLKEYNKTPFWQGYYVEFVNLVKQKPNPPLENQAPLFEKIRQGEFWRLFTPCLLHADIFHLLFNMAWLFILGKQIEQRIKPFRYLLFILAVGIFSNIAQYMMSGANFIGFSGILCGMFAFIWMRQKRAAWEGYQLQNSTIILIGVFVGAMLLIQVASFLSEVYADSSIVPMIANTAHFSGAFIGLILGRMNFFAWKQ